MSVSELYAWFSRLRSRRGPRCSILPIMIAAFLLPAVAVRAQLASFSGPPSLLGGFGSLLPTGVAVDASGNVYVANASGGGTANQILKITPAGGSSVLNLSGLTLRAALGLAVDGAGYLYIADDANDGTPADNRVLKVKTDGSSAVVISAGTLNGPTAVTVDASGNLYIGDSTTSGSARVVKVPYSGGSYQSPVDFVSASTSIGSGGDLEYVAALAMDPAGEVLVTDSDGAGGRLIKVTSSGAGSELIANTQSIGAGGTLYSPNGVAADAQGNIFVADVEASDDLGRIVELRYSAGSYSSPIEYVPSTTSTLNYPNGLAIDSKGNLYATDAYGDAENPSGSGGVIKIATQSTDFGSIAVATTSAAASLNFVFSSGGSLNASTPYKVLTMGASGLDFAVVTSGTTCSGSVSTGGSCVVRVNFTPQYAGLRMGVVELLNTSGGVIASANLRGIGTGPQLIFVPGTSSTIGGGLSGAAGVAVDGSGNVYVADGSNNAVKKIPAGCATSACVTTLGGGFNVPTGVAVDGSGNVYVADQANSAVKEMAASCTTSACVTTLGGDISYPDGLAVDSAGNVYVADSNNSLVKEMPAGCTSSSCVTTLAVGFSFGAPTSVAVDASGNVFVADQGNGAIYKLPATCITGANDASCVTAIGGGFSAPYGVGVDGTGNVYVADWGNSAVKEMSASCASSSCVSTLDSQDFSSVLGVAVDGSGNVYAGDSNNAYVVELNRSTAPSLSFGSINVGQTSSAQTVTLGNIGNATLSFPIPTTGNNPSVATYFALSNATTCPELTTSSSSAGTLSAGATCALAVEFEPTAAGSASGSLVIKDNHLNAASPSYTTQSISLSGTGIVVVPGAPTIGAVTAGSAQVTVNFSAPASDGGATITSYTATSSPGGLTGTCSSSPCVVTGLTNGTAYTFTVTATNSAGTGSDSATSSSVTPKASQTITFNNPGTQNFGTSPTLSGTASSGLLVSFSSSTTAVCTVTSGGALTFITAGTCTVDADQAGNSTYAAASQVAQSFSVAAVVPGAPTIGTATAGNTQATVGFTAPAFTGGASITSYSATANPGGATGTCASSPCTVTGLTNGTGYTFTVTATNSAGTGSASAASGSVTPHASQTITFNNPGAQNFGTSPTLTATASSALPVSFSSSTTGVCTVTTGGVLTFVSAGTCTINADQAGNSSFAAAAEVTQSFTVAAVLPGAPTIGTATAGNAQASVSFTAPAFTGGASITGYTATSNPGGLTATCANSPCVVTGLSAESTYTFTVTATNAVGTGAASGASNAVTIPAPNFVVTTSVDDAGTASNCTPQSTAGTGTDAACSLRDALLHAASTGAANISFDSTAFAGSTTITLNGALTLPAKTAIAGTGTSQLILDGNGAGNILQIASGVTASVSNLTLQNALGTSSQTGGAISNAGSLTLSGVVVKASRPGQNSGGGGIYNASTGVLTLTNCTLANNIASYTGFGSSGYGGGLSNNGGAVHITGCTFTGNEASQVGGGIYSTGGTVSIDNSTLTAATGTTNGGGVGVNGGAVTVTNSTIAGNHVSGNAGGIYVAAGTVSLGGTILAANTDGSGTPDGDGAFTDAGHNLIGNGDGVSGITNGTNNDLVGTAALPIDAMLAALGSYGGPTQTMIPLPGSPAVCAISPSSASGTDQRGNARTTTYGSTTCQDLGAAQSSYSLSFSTQPSPISPATAIYVATNFQAAVAVDESGSPFAAMSVTIPLTLTTGSGTLAGGSASTSAGVATYSSLNASAAGASDVLTATLSLNSSSALSVTTASNAFEVTSTAPTVTGINPSIGSLAGGTVVTITGTNFTGATSVYFGSAPASNFVVNSATQITATTSAQSAGTVDVTVTASAGTSATATSDQFVYLAPPTVAASFGPSTVVLGNAGTLTFVLTNPNTAGTLTGIAFSNALPAGLIFGSPSNLTTTCGGTAGSTGSTVTLNSVSLSAGASCNLTVRVTSNAPGTYTDTTGVVTSTQTTPSATATAAVTIAAAPVTASITAANRTYNGSTAATITACTLTGVLTADLGNVSCSASSAVFASNGAGNGIAVTASGLSLSGAAAGNYSLASTTANTTANIAPAALTITASSISMNFHGMVPAITASYAGFAGTDSPASLTSQPTCTTTATSQSAVGIYPSTCTGAVDANYAINYAAGSVTVRNMALTIAANNATRVYGADNPIFAGSVTGAQNGDAFVESFATSATANSAVGAYAIVPSVSGANLAAYTQAIQNGTLTVTQAGSVVTLTSSAINANLNANVTFTATVSSTTTGTPTGVVQFLDGSTLLSTVPLNASGVGTYTAANLAVGSHTLHAVYAGDQNFIGSTTSLVQQITAPDYSLTANPSSLTLKAGQTGDVIFTFAPVGGYIGTVNFACAGLPASVSCSFAPSSLTADGSNQPQTSHLTITTEGSNTGTVAHNGDTKSNNIVAAYLCWLPSLLLGGFLFWQRRRLSKPTQQLLGLLFLAVSVFGVIGCGFAPPQTPVGAHTVTVTATATATATGSGSGSGSNGGSDTHAATFTLTITQ